MRRPDLALAAVIVALLMLPVAGQAQTATLTVIGQGSAGAAPDIATIRAGVETDAATAAEALEANSTLAARIIETLKAAGVAPADLQTSDLAVHPLYREASGSMPRGGPEVVGYRVTNAVTVTIRELGGMGAVIDGLVGAGANRIDSVAFGLSDAAAATDEARRRAVADARRAAETLAGAAGVKLARIVSIADGAGPGPMPTMRFRAEAMSVPVEAGESTVTAAVTVVWEIAPSD